MSHDALSHLVQRTLHPEPVVGPRLPSRYEGGDEARDADIGRYDEVTAQTAPASPSRTRAPDSPRKSPRPGTARDVAELGGPGRPGRDDPPAGSVATTATSTPPERTSEARHPAQTGIPGGGPAPDSHPAGHTTGEPAPAGQPHPAGPLRHANEAVPRAAALTPAVVVAAKEPSRPEPEPVIHITIGRVEVRATPSTTPAVTPPKPPGRRVMSLTEYLDRRGRGSSP